MQSQEECSVLSSRKGEQGGEDDLWVSFHLRQRCTEVRGCQGEPGERKSVSIPSFPSTLVLCASGGMRPKAPSDDRALSARTYSGYPNGTDCGQVPCNAPTEVMPFNLHHGPPHFPESCLSGCLGHSRLSVNVC